MNPVSNSVIDHIKARRGQVAPFNDSRKIALVLHGGLMTGINGAGALKALQEMGFGKVFDEIYAISAGFPNACYFLSEDGQKEGSKGMSIYYENLVSRDFINYSRFWKIVDVEYPIKVMQTDKKLDLDSLLKSSTKLFVGLWNTRLKKPDYICVNDFSKDKFFDLMKACVSIPYFHPGSVKVNGTEYMDLPLFHGKSKQGHVLYPISHGATDVLVINNYHNQTASGLPDNVYVINPPRDFKLSRFETDREKLISVGKKMGEFMKKQFGEEGSIRLHLSPTHEVRN